MSTTPPGVGDLTDRDRAGLDALAAVTDATRVLIDAGPAARSALLRAAPTGVIPSTVHAPTRLALTRTGLAYPDGPLLRLTDRGRRTAAWTAWADHGSAVPTHHHTAPGDHR